jgi:very-short-patch-repair endonuclease
MVFEKGHKVPKKWRKIVSKVNKGKHRSPNTEFKKEETYEQKYGIKKAKEIKKKMSLIRSGEGNSMYGKGATKGSFKEGHKLLDGSEKGWFKKGHKESKEMKQKRIKATLKAIKIKPNLPEKQMIQIVKLNNLPFNYVGDGKIIIGGFNPDFLSKNPRHIIEVFGDYWHNRKEIKRRDERRLNAYASLGYKPLIIWEHELKEPQRVIERIVNFLEKK